MARNDAARNEGSADREEPTAVLPETASQLVELEQVQQQLTQAEERAKDHWNQYLRAAADLENMRKRVQREVDAAARSGTERFAQELLPAMDSLELAVASAGGADTASLAEGQEATLRLLRKAFEAVGLREIDPEGEPFDPARHEAVMVQESRTAEPNSVLQVVQRGYELDNRLLRPARVIVSRKPGA